MTRPLDREKALVPCKFVSFQMISSDQMSNSEAYLQGNKWHKKSAFKLGNHAQLHDSEELDHFLLYGSGERESKVSKRAFYNNM